MGGMAAFIPSRARPRGERARDGEGRAPTRRARPATASTARGSPTRTSCPWPREQFDAVLGDRPNQVERQRDDVEVTAADLLDAASPAAAAASPRLACATTSTSAIQYISAWLRGNGAAAIHGLMEDAATAEIARSQVWQWIRHGVTLAAGEPITPELVRGFADEELERIEVRDRSAARSSRRPRWARASPSSSRSRRTSGCRERRGGRGRRPRRHTGAGDAARRAARGGRPHPARGRAALLHARPPELLVQRGRHRAADQAVVRRHARPSIPRMEGNPPLYYVLAWLWAKVFGTGEVGLRSLSAVCGTAICPSPTPPVRGWPVPAPGSPWPRWPRAVHCWCGSPRRRGPTSSSRC